MLTAVLILVFVACGIFAWYRRCCEGDEPPAFSGAFPLIGHLHLLVGDCKQLWIFLKEVAYECLQAGGVISASIGPKTVYFVTDPDNFLKIADTCLQKDTYYEFAKPWLGDGLLTSDCKGRNALERRCAARRVTPLDVSWKKHRSLLDAAFNQTVLDGYMEVFNGQSRRLVVELAAEVGKGPFDLLVYTRKNALATTCLTVFGEEFGEKSLLNNNYAEAMDQMFDILVQRFQRPWLHCDYIYSWSELKKKQDEYLRILHSVSNTVLKKRKADYLKSTKSKNTEEQTNDAKFMPFIDLLLELAAERGTFNDREIREHVDTMMFCAHDAVASMLMYTVLLVGSYPDVQERVFEELHKIFGDDDRDVTKQDLSRLVYMEAVIKESMRIYPVVPLTTRHLDRDVKLRNCTLKKGRTCFLFIYGVNRHPMWGFDAGKFKPERWLEPAAMPECPNAFAGFGMGTRNCLGKSHALMSMKTTLAHVFRHYRVCGNHEAIVNKIDVMLRPVSGHHVTIAMRKNKTK